MKTMLIAALLFFYNFSFAAETVRVSVRAPFSCENAETQAQAELAEQCQNQGGSLMHIQYFGCISDGDDGGYVNYFLETVQGFCQTN
ncbi:MAG TPA: hypothetical protein VF412_16900 [Bdellovibrio sp.]|uniref:hypothetical protein n=1 Tax=Bdellovibrio sp. TaxID=28201 RepID=UPI002F0CE35A